MVLNHLNTRQVYRKQAPQLFHGVVDSKNKELAEGIETYAKVPLPPELKQRKEALDLLKMHGKHRRRGASIDRQKHNDMYTIIEKKESTLKANLASPGRKTKDWGALPQKNTDPMNDTAYVRRLKKANYGKWYMDPSEYNKKADFITQ